MAVMHWTTGVKGMNIETMTAAVISTGHLTELSINSAPWGYCGAQLTHGAIVNVPPCDDVVGPNTPEDVLDLFSWARAAGFDWVWLDADARTVDGLRSYDWETA